MYILKLLTLSVLLCTATTACQNPEKKEKEHFSPVPGGDGCDKEAEY